MAIKLDGTGSKIILYAGTGNSTTIAASPTAAAWTMTLPPNDGLNGQALITDGNGNLTWGAGGGGGSIIVVNDTTTDAFFYPMSADLLSGQLSTAYVSSPEHTFNPAKGILSAPHVESSEGIHLNSNVVTKDFTIPNNTNGLSAGPIVVNPTVTVTVNPGLAWVVV